MLKLISSRGEPTRLEQLGHVEGTYFQIFGKQICTDGLPGLPIGSVFIDRFIHQLMCEKLEQIRQHLQLTPSEVAWKMISGRFQRLKCAFGTEATLTPWLKLDVPSLESDSEFPEADIYNGQMQIAW